MHGSLTTVQQSLESGASLDECDPEIQWRPMAPAMEEGREDTVWYLYEQGIEIRHMRGWFNPRHEDYCKCHENLLLLAARGGHEAPVSFFMDHLPRPYHVDFPASSEGRTPLIEATDRGHLAIIQRLVDAGADIQARDQRRTTPFALAARGGHHGIMQFLLRQGADPTAMDIDDCSPLSWAARGLLRECPVPAWA